MTAVYNYKQSRKGTNIAGRSRICCGKVLVFNRQDRTVEVQTSESTQLTLSVTMYRRSRCSNLAFMLRLLHATQLLLVKVYLALIRQLLPCSVALQACLLRYLIILVHAHFYPFFL